MQNYRKPAFAGLPDDATKEDLEDVLADLVEREAVTPEVVRAVYEERRRLKKKVLLAGQYDEETHYETVAKIERQYMIMKAALERFGFSTEGMPERQDIVDLLKPSMLVPAYEMKEPALLLVPPLTAKEMVKLIDKHRLPNQYKTSYPGWLDGHPYFWDTYWGKRPDGWAIAIAEGEADAGGTTDSTNNSQRYEKWKNKLAKKGLEQMDGACEYLTLWMLRAHEGVTVDRHPVALRMSHGGLDILTVSWFDRGIAIKPSQLHDNWPALHMRGMIWIRKPW